MPFIHKVSLNESQLMIPKWLVLYLVSLTEETDPQMCEEGCMIQGRAKSRSC